jgi:hypothetical protein
MENWSDGVKGIRNGFSAPPTSPEPERWRAGLPVSTPTLHHSMWAQQIICYEKYYNFPASDGIEIPRSLIKVFAGHNIKGA